MKKFFGLIVGIFFLLSTFGMASATILNFDNLRLGDAITDYGGFTWDALPQARTIQYSTYNAKYTPTLSPVSATMLAEMDGMISVSRNSVFDFNGAYLTGYGNAGDSQFASGINITGYLGTDIVGTFDINTTAWTLKYFDLSMTSVDRVEFTPGSSHNTTAYFLMDNFTYSEPSTDPVPEPATMFLFCIGLLGLAGINRRKTA